MSAILGLGVGAGIVLAGPIIEHLSYHWLFWIPLVLSLAAARDHVHVRPRLSGPGARWHQLVGGGSHVGLAHGGAVGVSYGPTWGWKDPTVLAMFGAAAVSDPCSGCGPRCALRRRWWT